MTLLYLKNFVRLLVVWIGGKVFWNYCLYPKHQENQDNSGSLVLKYTGKLAVVMQGPVITDSNFTVETLKIYRKNFPEAMLILSSWIVPDEMQNILQRLDVVVIRNQKPDKPGRSNVNLQIITSKTGILAAKNSGAQYILKTRTDQRIYHPGLDAYLMSLIALFPCSNNALQEDRLICVSLGTFKYRLYSLSDMFMFGRTQDMLMYWDAPMDEQRDAINDQPLTTPTWRASGALLPAEAYLCTGFLNKLGLQSKNTLADWFDVLQNQFLVIDQHAVRLYWHKYTLDADRYAYFGLFNPEIQFNDWLLLYHARDRVVCDETILDQPVFLSE